ncbi:hypothetical protein Q5530_14870 [Saccharothrix sp. BKS2]|uniref:hypothetical protein n=1 Tax=Saccharothrix sp. BKS2 TaxID=3064400 RepID=UPI0039EBC311
MHGHINGQANVLAGKVEQVNTGGHDRGGVVALTVVGLALVAAVVLVVALMVGHGDPASGGTTGTSVTTSGERPPDRERIVETAANRNGSPTFADNLGKASTVGDIPYGTEVEVSCVTPNLSAMTSVNAFYRIETAPWQGQFSPANTFLNGDEPGQPGTHDINEAVPPCA